MKKLCNRGRCGWIVAALLLLVLVVEQLRNTGLLALVAPFLDASSGEERVGNGDAWDDFLGRLELAGRIVERPGIPDDPHLRAQGYRNLLRLLSGGAALTGEFANPDRLILYSLYDLGTAYAQDNPDTLYHTFPVREEATYRLRAWLPSHAEPATFISANVLVPVDGGLPRAGANIDDVGGGIEFDAASESFDIWISAVEHEGNWLPLEPGVEGQRVFVRQTFGDWSAQRPLRLELERIDNPTPATSFDATDFARGLDELGLMLLYQAAIWPDKTLETRDKVGVNILPVPGPRPDIAGLTGQNYGQGAYEIGPDEALVVSLKPPGTCAYWGFQLLSLFGESLNFDERIVSINHSQAHVDSDGQVRFVIAASDPGTANWLDIGGGPASRYGMMVLRYTACDPRERFGLPSVERMPAALVADALPNDHPGVSPQERNARLVERRRHLFARYGQ